MTSIQVPLCMACSRLRMPSSAAGTYTCSAFPGGIPEAIFEDGYDHREAFDGDRGIRFKADPDHTAVLTIYENRKALR